MILTRLYHPLQEAWHEIARRQARVFLQVIGNKLAERVGFAL